MVVTAKKATAAKKAAKKAGPRREERPRAIVPVADDSPWIKMLVYGDPGVGKSVLASTAPKSLLLLNNTSQAAGGAILGTSADRWHVQDYNDFTEAVEYLCYTKDHGYEWVWFDNMTLFQEQGMDQIMLDLVSEAGKGKSHRNQFIPDKAEYLENQSRLGTLVRQMIQQVQANLGFVCHTMESEDNEGNIIYLPMLQGGGNKFSVKMCGYMDVIAYMNVRRTKEGPERWIITDKRSSCYARDNFSALGGKMINPTIPKIMEAIAKKRTTASRKTGSPTKKSIPKRSAT